MEDELLLLRGQSQNHSSNFSALFLGISFNTVFIHLMGMPTAFLSYRKQQFLWLAEYEKYIKWGGGKIKMEERNTADNTELHFLPTPPQTEFVFILGCSPMDTI